MATESKSFVAATQKWVANRIQEVKNYVQDVKASIVELITNLANIHDNDMKTVGGKFAELADKVVTGALQVDGDAAVDGSLTVSAGISSAGLASSPDRISDRFRLKTSEKTRWKIIISASHFKSSRGKTKKLCQMQDV